MKNMKRTVFSLFLLLMVTGVLAQKIDTRLTELVKKSAAVHTNRASAQSTASQEAYQKKVKESYNVAFNADGSVSTLGVTAYLKKDAECPTAQLEANGIHINGVLDNMVFLAVPADKLSALETIDDIILAVPEGKVQPMLMDARKVTNADKVTDATQATAAGLPQAYTGKGVVLGIIDQGIDYNHAVFYDPTTGAARVKQLIQYEEGTNLTPAILEDPNMYATWSSDITDTSHGTHTSAIAGGSLITATMNDNSKFEWQGVAPETDLILVGVGKNNSDAAVNDAIDRVFNYATSVNKPAVVSISMGSLDRLHDGSDAMAKKIKEVTESGTKQGRVVVVSSANAADNKMSIQKKLGTPDADGWQLKAVMGVTKKKIDELIAPYNYYLRCNLLLYAGDGQDFTAELRLVNISTGEVISGKSNVENHMINPMNPTEKGGFAAYTLDKGSRVNIKGNTVTVYTGSGGAYLDDENLRMALFVKGNVGQTINVIRTDDNAEEFGFYIPATLADKGYTEGVPDIAFNAGICDPSVISVGAYNTRMDWVNYQGNTITTSTIKSKVTGQPQESGAITDFSSFGIDDNGLHIPTVVAPGNNILSAFSSFDETHFDTSGNLLTEGNHYNIVYNITNPRSNWFAYDAGTSMSCPHVAGIVALWMQAKPTLTVNEIKNVLQETCIKDEFVTNAAKIPSGNTIQAGYGKIDALAGLKKILGSTGIETVGADGRREATPSTMYSVDAPVYNMMGQQVDKSHRGLVIYKGRKYFNN